MVCSTPSCPAMLMAATVAINWLRQTAVNCSLIKSTDHGRTWTRSAAKNEARPMWPAGAFWGGESETRRWPASEI